jgi:hypothetical protein
MFAFSVTAKLLILYLSFKYGDAGRARRPWILGILLGFVFTFFDVCFSSWNLHVKFFLAVAYFCYAIFIMQIYYRTHSILGSLAIVAISTAILFFGIPFFLGPLLEK